MSLSISPETRVSVRWPKNLYFFFNSSIFKFIFIYGICRKGIFFLIFFLHTNYFLLCVLDALQPFYTFICFNASHVSLDIISIINLIFIKNRNFIFTFSLKVNLLLMYLCDYDFFPFSLKKAIKMII